MVKPPARPFLKWAGGKAQLMEEFTRRVPGELKKGELPVFVEPFVGGGAVFFHYNSHFRFEECHIFDINEELVLAYTVVKREVEELIQVLAAIEKDFLSQDEAGRKQFSMTCAMNTTGKNQPSISLPLGTTGPTVLLSSFFSTGPATTGFTE